MKRSLLIIMVIALVAAMFIGCAPDQAATDTNEDAAADTAEDTGDDAATNSGEDAATDSGEDAAADAEEDEIVIGVIPCGMTSPYHSQIVKGAQKICDEYGWKCEVECAASESDFAGQLTVMEQFIAKGVDGIVMSAIDAVSLAPGLEKANAAGIPVVHYTTLTPFPSGEMASYVGYSQSTAAYTLGQHAAELLNGEGKVYVLTGVPGYVQITRTNGFIRAIQEYPGIEIAGVQSAEYLRDKAVEVATTALQANPDIDLFYGNSDEMAIGASIAAQNLGMDVYTLGIDGNPSTLDEIELGNVTATMGVYPDKMGEACVQQLKKLFDTGEIEQYWETASVVVDADNLEDYVSGALFVDPIQGEEEKAEEGIIEW